MATPTPSKSPGFGTVDPPAWQTSSMSQRDSATDSPPVEPSPAAAGIPIGRPATIVVGYSAKPEGRAALDRAVVAGKLAAATIIVVHTVPGQELAAISAELESAGLRYELRHAAEEQDPAEELIKVADGAANAMIVIGLRRRSAVGKLLLGSSAQRVLLDASCPVLAVKADAPTQGAAPGG